MSKKIAILGYGVEGQSILKYLLAHGEADITIWDEKNSPENLPEGIKSRVGKFKNLDEFDLIYRSPSILPTRPELASARQISTAINLFFANCPTKNTVGVTGTKGKGTTSTLISELLKADGKTVHLGGNIGTCPLDFLDKIKPDDFVVLELSSFQTMDLDYSPHVAVMLMTTSEHLDMHSSENEYVMAKAKMIMNQDSSDICFYNEKYPNTSKMAIWGGGEKIPFSSDCVNKWLPEAKISLKGKHNLENIAGALAVARYFNVTEKNQRKVVGEFHGLPHRLEEIGEWQGVKFINDSFSTTPETAIAALESCPDKSVIWLAGGSSKGSEFSEMTNSISQKVKCAILFGDEADKISAIINPETKIINLGKNPKLEEIWKTALDNSKQNDIILLSPACASFGLFQNYKHRGDWFRANFQKLNP